MRTEHRFIPLILLGLALLLATGCAHAADWKRTVWHGEAAWESTDKGWTAVVSAERARLIALRPPGSAENVLFADMKNEFSWGGHRFWLGPASTWGAPWPPPADWERSAAGRVTADAGVLQVESPHADERFPAIVRSYEWRDGLLHCTTSWTGSRFYGIHILQMPPTAVVRVKRTVTDQLPNGYALLPIFRRAGILTNRPINPAVSSDPGEQMELRHVGTTEKIGLLSQPIEADVGVWRLTLRRGRMEGFSGRLPDDGLITQVFVGNNDSAFIEIEQLTPYAGAGKVLSEIIVDPGVAGRSAAR